MKILVFCVDFYPRNTGYSNAFQNLIKAVSKEKKVSQIDVIAQNDLNGANEIDIKKTTIYRIKKLQIKYLRFIFNGYLFSQKIIELEKKNNYNLILIETFEPIVMIGFLPRSLQRKIIYRIHAAYETERRFFYPGLLFFISKYLVKYFVKKKIINICSTNSYHIQFAKKYFLNNNLYYICQKKFFTLPNTFEHYAENFNALNDKLEVLLLGRMDQSGYLQKGFDDFLDSLTLINDSLLAECNISIIGSGKYYSYFERKINYLGLNKNIKLIKYISHNELINKLSKNDLVVMPSRYEGLSMFALEAIATSNIVLYAKSGGLVDLVDNNGFMFEPQNIENIATQFEKIIKLSEEEKLKLKKNSYELFLRKFSTQKVTERLFKMIDIIESSK